MHNSKNYVILLLKGYIKRVLKSKSWLVIPITKH